MSILAAVGQKYLVTVQGKVDGQRTMTNFCYQLSALAGAPSTDDVATEIGAKFAGVAGMVPLLADAGPSNWSIDYLDIQCIDPVRVRKISRLVNVNGNMNACEAPGTTMCYTRAGDLAGRKRQSTVHLPCSTDGADITAGRPTLALLNKIQLIANQNLLLITSLAPSFTVNPVINNGAGGANVTLITRAFAADTIRTMRRRVVGRGI